MGGESSNFVGIPYKQQRNLPAATILCSEHSLHVLPIDPRGPLSKRTQNKKRIFLVTLFTVNPAVRQTLYLDKVRVE